MSNNLVLNAGAVLQYALDTNSVETIVSGNLTLNGILNISDAGGFSTGSYTLFGYGGTLTTNGAPGILTIGTTPDPSLVYTVDITSNGLVRLAVAAAVAPVAGFSATPTNGVAPLTVSFTDASTGTISNWFWDFGDGNTTNFTAETNPVHTYGAGVYAVTLVVSGQAGGSTNIQSGLVTVLDPFMAWQLQYFGCTNCPQADPNADPLGKGMSNTNQFLVGLNPTNPASVFRVLSVVQQSNDVVVTWAAGGGRTNQVQATAGDASGGYTNNFADLPGSLTILSGNGDTITNYLDAGGATNAPSRYYRIRLAP